MTLRRIVGLSLALALIAGLAIAQRPSSRRSGVATVEILDVGQGDSILVRSPEGKTALIDAGPHHEQAANLLRARGVSSLDLIVLTHHHQDHYGGMEAVVRRFKPRVFLDSTSSHTSPHYIRLLEAIRDHGVGQVELADHAQTIELGSVKLTVFPKAPEDRREENNNSIGLRLAHGAFSILLPGDAQEPERRWWEQTVPYLVRDCTVLKLAHHGSHNGTDVRWLDLVRPELAVASVGATNDFGHPSSQTIALLERLGIPLLRTDRDGTVKIESDGRRWWLARHQVAVRAPPAAKPRTKAKRDPEVVAAPANGRINVNTATEAQLEGLPGIGPVIARRIVEGRPYRSVDDLGRVKEVGPKRLAEIRPLVTAE